MPCRCESPWSESIQVVVPEWGKNFTMTSCKREMTTCFGVKSVCKLTGMGGTRIMFPIWFTHVFYQHVVYIQITIYEMTHHHINIIQNQNVILVWNSGQCNFVMWTTPKHLMKNFQLRHPGLQNGHPKRHLREPMSLADFPAELPRPPSWSHDYINLVHQSNYFSKQVIVFSVLCLVILALGGNKNPHFVCSWNP